MKKCEYCRKYNAGNYGSGRFCKEECARGYSTKLKRKLINKVVSEKLKNKPQHGDVELICEECKNKFIVKYFKRKQRFCSSKCVRKNLSNDMDFRKKLSNSLKGKTGGYREGAGRSRGGYYKGKYFNSPFEIEVAKFLTKKKIEWKRNTTRLYYIWNNEKKYYIPDFLINKKIYLETKGYWYGNKKERTLEAVKQNSINWILLMQKEEWNINKSILLEKIMAHGTA